MTFSFRMVASRKSAVEPDVEARRRFHHLELQEDAQSCAGFSSSKESDGRLEKKGSSSSSSNVSPPSDSLSENVLPPTTSTSSQPISSLHLNLIISPNGRVKRQLSVLEELAISEDKLRFTECLNVFHEEFQRRKVCVGGAVLEVIEENHGTETEGDISTTLHSPLSRMASTRERRRSCDPSGSVEKRAVKETPLKGAKLEKLRALRNDIWKRQIRKK